MRFCSIRGQRGAVMAESALSMALFLLIVLVGFQLVLCTFKEAALKQGLQRAARFAALGMASQDADPVGLVLNKAREFSNVTIDSQNFHACVLDTSGQCSDTGLGSGGQWVRLRATATMPTILGLYRIQVSGSAVAKNEPLAWH